MSNDIIDGSSPTVAVGLRVTISLSKDVSVNVSDYVQHVDFTEDGAYPYLDFDDTDFREAVLEQVDVPMPDDWNVEEFDVQKL